MVGIETDAPKNFLEASSHCRETLASHAVMEKGVLGIPQMGAECQHPGISPVTSHVHRCAIGLLSKVASSKIVIWKIPSLTMLPYVKTRDAIRCALQRTLWPYSLFHETPFLATR